MNSLKLYGARDLRYEEAEKPRLVDGKDVIVKVKACGICGSDMSRYKKMGAHTPGQVWGHEFAGNVEQVGEEVTSLKVGDRVAGCPALIDEDDYYYRAGQPARADSLSAIGAKEPGGFAEYIKLPEKNFVKVPDDLDFDSASMVEPSTVVLHGYYRTNLTVGDDVVIVGAGGTIGLFAVQWAKIFGAKRVIAVDIDDEKLQIAQELGADYTINSLNEDVLVKVAEYTDGMNADIVVEAAGTPITASTVFGYAKKGGGVVFLGIPYADVAIERFYFEKILRSELTVWGSWSCVSAPFPGKEWSTTIHFMNNKRLNTEKMITHRIPLDKGPKMFERLMERKELIGKVIMYPEK
ncbi:galactitol-1-phosphate 5-dehydrogenase [Peribacillus loiseleuriae]|uniref:Iditol 2-dehydrogenase n=1 Tax=Peribacillus loiseleuriae TaxID=1679170 RepID=A0A0K9GSX7_9BACI|nr:galactitol-1-phosphate 5-dehydrogenase [Peribacillus loiseleuriae]KMY49740.1 iditol 2-dehydrogenase [Peribacillus loiseleuriae]